MNHVFIIAEAGVNHNGSLDLAKQLIDAAAAAGADAVKFQTFQADKLVSKEAPKAGYQLQTTGGGETQHQMLKRLELDPIAHRELMEHCQQAGILFLSTPFDLESVDLLRNLGMKLFKIPSGEITNLPYLRKVGRLSQKVILSTGMADFNEVENALDALIRAGTPKDKITVLHCTTEYPAPIAEVNLRAMVSMREKLQIQIGYSDHTQGIAIPIAATALGARVIEKHFTLDRTLPGPDHQASLEPDELKAMVAAIRAVEQALGEGVKQVSPCETGNRLLVRKSIVAAENIARGEIFTETNLTVKRPGDGLSPMLWDKVLGTAATKPYVAGEKIVLP